MESPLRIVYAGTPAFAVPALAALVRRGHEVRGVITQPDRRAGRGRRLAPPPVKEEAQRLGLSVIQTARLDADAWQTAFGASIDVLVVVAFGQILPAAVLEQPRAGAINVHASLLPRWRGAAPIARALLAGDTETGVSIMQMTPGLDAGPVLLRQATPIQADDTAGTLHDRLAKMGAEALLSVLGDWPQYQAQAQPQDAAQATYAPKIERAEARLDWTQPAIELERRVRAFQPTPCAYTELEGSNLRIHAAQALASTPDRAPGTITAAGRYGVDVATGSGILRLLRVQPAGRRVMDAAAFSQARQLVGACLGGQP